MNYYIYYDVESHFNDNDNCDKFLIMWIFSSLTCYPDLDTGADGVRWLGPAVVVTLVCFCSRANV